MAARNGSFDEGMMGRGGVCALNRRGMDVGFVKHIDWSMFGWI